MPVAVPLSPQPLPSRVVLDTNVWLDLLWFRDPACGPLRSALSERRLQAVTRDDCREEWKRVLGYPELTIGHADRERLLAEFDQHAESISTTIDGSGVAALPRCADPDDQKFLELARDGQALALLSRDRALLTLSRRLQRHGLFPVLTPLQLGPLLL